MTPTTKPGDLILADVLRVAAEHAPTIVSALTEIARIVRARNTDLCTPDEACAPPLRSDGAIDAEVDRMIEKGEL